MGLIQAAIGAAGGVLADSWKDYFYCESLPNNVLVTKGKKRVSGRSSNYKGNENIITNGSVIAVADGQCMLLVDQGQVTEICAQPGEFVYDSGTEPSLFTGDLGNAVKDTFANIGRRFTFGGDAPKDQRIYFFNTKEITGNKYGTPNPVPYRVVDQRAGIDLDISVKCFGEYSYRIADPVLFYTNVCANVSEDYTRDQIDGQLKSELLTALQPAFAKISEEGIRYSALPGHTTELSEALNEVLTKKWKQLRGLEIVSFGVSSVKADEEDEQMIKQMQRNAAYTNQNLAAATLVGAQAQAMQDAAKNANGAAMGFMGVNMAAAAGGVNAAELFRQGAAQQQAAPAPAASSDSWTCPKCGSTASGKFCPECGTPKPVLQDGWKCPQCGAVNTGKFCMECGTKKPEALTNCPSCGAKIKDPSAPPKFCPECGFKLHD